jgi:myo-inositol-1-phosphate synthase
MTERRVGIWLIGAFGGVGTTTSVGLAALARGQATSVGMVTALPALESLDLDSPSAFVVGGHDIRTGSFSATAAELHRRAGMFNAHQLLDCDERLQEWTANIRPGVMIGRDAAAARLADRPDLGTVKSAREAVARIQVDLGEFVAAHRLDQMVVINVASTEPPFEQSDLHQSWTKLEAALDRPDVLPTSSLYALAAIDSGHPYVNITPSTGASLPALEQWARSKNVPLAGQDLKTGETLLKSVLAPMFAKRNLKVLSWVGHNILGNRDGLVLSDPANKASKVRSKDRLLADMLGYRPQSHVSIEYIESLDDWKTAWDHVHFEGFLGTKMTLQFTWQGCDSILAAPLVIDLARLTLLAKRRGQSGSLGHLACFFKSPVGCTEHDFGRQFEFLLDGLGQSPAP